MTEGKSAADRPAPVLHDQGDVAHIQFQEKSLEIVDMRVKRVLACRRSLALTEAHMIGNYDTMKSCRAVGMKFR